MCSIWESPTVPTSPPVTVVRRSLNSASFSATCCSELSPAVSLAPNEMVLLLLIFLSAAVESDTWQGSSASSLRVGALRTELERASANCCWRSLELVAVEGALVGGSRNASGGVGSCGAGEFTGELARLSLLWRGLSCGGDTLAGSSLLLRPA